MGAAGSAALTGGPVCDIAPACVIHPALRRLRHAVLDDCCLAGHLLETQPAFVAVIVKLVGIVFLITRLVGGWSLSRGVEGGFLVGSQFLMGSVQRAGLVSLAVWMIFLWAARIMVSLP